MPEDPAPAGRPAERVPSPGGRDTETAMVAVPDGLQAPGPGLEKTDSDQTAIDFAGDEDPTLPSPRTESDPGSLASAVAPATTKRTGIHLLLAIFTFLACTWAHLTPSQPTSYWVELAGAAADPAQLSDALTFAVAVMLILVARELGHRIAARLAGVETSLPYFIPAPTLLGTLGTVVTLKSPPADRGALLGFALAGPLCGLAVAVPMAAWGLAASEPISLAGIDPSRPFAFGSSLLFDWLRLRYAPMSAGLDLHPVAFAGWVGLFITSINLIPASQLDGGHIAYALFGRAQRRLSSAFVLGLFAAGMILALSGPSAQPNWGGAIWIFWALLLFVVGLGHPAVRNPDRSLNWRQRTAGWFGLFMLVVTFVPVPVTFIPAPVVTLPAMQQPAPGPAQKLDDRDGTYQAEEFAL